MALWALKDRLLFICLLSAMGLLPCQYLNVSNKQPPVIHTSVGQLVPCSDNLGHSFSMVHVVPRGKGMSSFEDAIIGTLTHNFSFLKRSSLYNSVLLQKPIEMPIISQLRDKDLLSYFTFPKCLPFKPQSILQ